MKVWKMTEDKLIEVSFGVATIQKLRRITLDQNLLRTLSLTEGDSVEVTLLVSTGEIRLRKSKDSPSHAMKKIK